MSKSMNTGEAGGIRSWGQGAPAGLRSTCLCVFLGLCCERLTPLESVHTWAEGCRRARKLQKRKLSSNWSYWAEGGEAWAHSVTPADTSGRDHELCNRPLGFGSGVCHQMAMGPWAGHLPLV